jgi:hypothetical protein
MDCPRLSRKCHSAAHDQEVEIYQGQITKLSAGANSPGMTVSGRMSDLQFVGKPPYNEALAENDMALAALKEAMEEFAALPPAFRFDEAMEMVKTVHDLDAMIKKADADFRSWRTMMVKTTRDSFKKMEAAAVDLPVSIYAPMLLRLIDDALEAARSSLSEFTGSYADRPDMAEMLKEVGGVTVDGARFLRKQMLRIDEIRQKQHDVHLLIIGALREYRSRYEPYVGDGANGDNEAAYLTKLHGRYAVVNAKLAQ